jgi:hypothetical protein
MLVYLHLRQIHNLGPELQELKDQIISTYPFLITQLFSFLSEAKNGTAIRESIVLLQMIRQGRFDREPFNSNNGIHLSKIPTEIHVENTNLNVRGQDEIYTHSELCWRFHIGNVRNGMVADIEGESKREEDELAIIRERRSNLNRECKEIALTPYYPKVPPSQCSCINKVSSSRLLSVRHRVHN